MEPTPNGRLILLLAASLLAVGFLFSNGVIIASAVAVFLYLLYEAIALRRAVVTFKDSAKLTDQSQVIETTVGRKVLLKSIIRNESSFDLRVVDSRRIVPPEMRVRMHSSTLFLMRHGEAQIEWSLEAGAPGKFELTRLAMTLERGGGLFRQTIELEDEITIVARPGAIEIGTPLEVSGLHDLSVDSTRRGRGTDFAGLRPWNPADDLHTIDWKATARTGKLMTKESYLERDPPIMLMVDNSPSMRTLTETHRASLFEMVTGQVADLLATPRLATNPVGIVLHDDRTVTAYVEPRLGLESRNRIIRILVENTAVAESSFAPSTSQPFAPLAGDMLALERMAAPSGKSRALMERFNTFAALVLPFYKRAISNRAMKLRAQGIFKAFQIVSDLPEPVLAIAITDGKTNLDGLREGAKHAMMFNHRVVIVLLSHTVKRPEHKALSGLMTCGAGIAQCTPDQLWRTVNEEIVAASRMRLVRLNERGQAA
jgi:uncharacterized protein (DUF58 family)